MIPADGGKTRRFWRPTAFRVGVLTGMVTFVVVSGGIYLAVRQPSAAFNIQVESSGADLSRHGAHQLEIRRERGPIMRQTCRDGCDDLSFRRKDGGAGDVHQVVVLDRAGQCLVCGSGLYTEESGGSLVAKWSVGGDAKLEGRAGYFRQQPDGSLSPVKAPPSEPPAKPPEPREAAPVTQP